MRVLLTASDDALPGGKMRVNLPALPRIGELLVIDRRNVIDPPDYFRVTEVCHIATGPLNEPVDPEVQLEFIGHAP
ncbi:hypothetical protein [Mycolicibacterium goodii]|uniref:hypothetical protein n=1 Tax=Mycolicibacterium goodii TaxID=134601 RepID=UPI001BDCCADB|nr:hypothetical protein [Mycolicibacterium goodii]MBU8830856.1 hypothetical protein [Mycolicibacterium goodii]